MSSNERAISPDISMEEAIAELEAISQGGSATDGEPIDQGEGQPEEETTQAERSRAAALVEELRQRAASAAGEGREAVRQQASSARRRAAQFARAHAEGINADEFVYRRRTSRNQKVAERATAVASMAPPTDHTLDPIGTGAHVTEMARSGIGMGALDLERPSPDAGDSGPLDPGVGGVDASINGGLLFGTGEDDDPLGVGVGFGDSQGNPDDQDGKNELPLAYGILERDAEGGA